MYFMAIWSILWSFGPFCGHLAYFPPFWYNVPRKIWLPWPTLLYHKMVHPMCKYLRWIRVKYSAHTYDSFLRIRHFWTIYFRTKGLSGILLSDKGFVGHFTFGQRVCRTFYFRTKGLVASLKIPMAELQSVPRWQKPCYMYSSRL
jgi:hypothetical protein